jgi:hypothetical protein
MSHQENTDRIAAALGYVLRQLATTAAARKINADLADTIRTRSLFSFWVLGLFGS